MKHLIPRFLLVGPTSGRPRIRHLSVWARPASFGHTPPFREDTHVHSDNTRRPDRNPERDSKLGKEACFKKVFRIDLSDATDVSGTDALPADALPKDIVPVTKALFLDLLDPAFKIAGDGCPETSSSSGPPPSGAAWMVPPVRLTK